MNNNELVLDSLYSEVLGISNTNNQVISIEGFDGFDDALEADIAKGFESLNFIDTYTALEQKNAAEMIRMCKKLSVNYGLKSGVNEKAAKSIESICNIYSTEEEKKESIFKRIFAAIKNILEKVAEFFLTIWDKIKRFFIINIGKLDRDLTSEEIKNIINNDEIWKNKPRAILKGNIYSAIFKGASELCQKAEDILRKMANTNDQNKMNQYAEEFDNINAAYAKKYGEVGLGDYKIEEVNDNNKRKLAAEWAGKVENLKKSIDSIKQQDKYIKMLSAMSKNAAKHADNVENGKWLVVGQDEQGRVILNWKQHVINGFRQYSKNLNENRKSFMDIINTIIFAKKLYNYGLKVNKNG